MAKQLQLRRGSTTEHGSFTGAVGEVTVDTDKDTVVVHDGSLAGGHPLATATNFRSTGIDDNSNALAMTIDSSEKVGIGTVAPDAGLDVARDSGVGPTQLQISGTNGYDTERSWRFEINAAEWGMLEIKPNTAQGNTTFTNGTGLTISRVGKVGIGTTATPADKLVIGGIDSSNNTTQNSIRWTDAGNNPLGSIAARRGANGYDGSLLFNTAKAASSGALTERMRIDTTGTVGIGTSGAMTGGLNVKESADNGPSHATSNAVAVYTNNKSVGVHLHHYGLRAVSETLEGTNLDPNQKIMIDARGSGDLLLQTEATGNVGIGTVTPLTQVGRTTLTISGSAGAALYLRDNADEDSWKLEGSDSSFNLGLDNTNDDGAANVNVITALASGRVGIGETGPDGTLHVRGSTDPTFKIHCDSTSNIQAFILKHQRAAGSTSASMINFVDAANGDSGIITSDGSTTTYYTTSDYRKKENVIPMTGAITRLQALKPSRFNFIVDPDKTVDGFLAHEAAEVVPEAVSGEKDAMKPEVLYDADDELPEGKSIGDIKTPSVPALQMLSKSNIVPLLVGALQEAIVRIEALEAAQTGK